MPHNATEHGQFAPMFKDHSLSEIQSGAHHRPDFSMDGSDMIETFTMDDAERAAFLNELVTIYVHPSTAPGGLPVVEPTVDGVSQPIIRGKPQRVKRKYVEALVAAYTVNYESNVADSAHMVDNKPRANVTSSYPFDVTHDTDRGRAWLRGLMQRPV